MIDYEKLKLAHEFVSRCETHFLRHIISKHENELTLCHHLPDMPDIAINDIDELIAKLKELTQPKPKYQVGQKVWVNNEDPEEFWIDSYIQGQYGLVEVKDTCWKGYEIESKIFPTREALIEAQISYWTCLKNEEISTRSDDMSMPSSCSESIRKHHELEDDDCKHESDGNVYGAIEWGAPPTYVCRKCRSAYR